MMLQPWPNLIPRPDLPTIPKTAAIPPAYFKLIQTGILPMNWWLPTKEPTSDAIDGVGIHAFATVGPAMTSSDLPAHFLPFAKTGHQYFGFDLQQEPRQIRYIDTEVDQWLTVAMDLPAFMKQLQPHEAKLPEISVDPQIFGHMAVIATAAEWPALFDYAREFMAGQAIGPWLRWLAQPKEEAKRQVGMEEFHFLTRYQPNFLTPNDTLTLQHVFG